MKRFLYCDSGFRASLGLFVLRVVVGAAFVLHGLPKIKAPFSWMPDGSPIPGFAQMLAAVAEFGGGIALILGVLTPIACLALAGTMAVAIGMVHVPQGHAFVGKPGESFELAAAYLASVVALLLNGPGRLSLDALLFRTRAAK
jgi:putative oxidoreductase